MCFIRACLRACTSEQDASRARAQVKAFATERGMQIAAWYVENESGAKLAARSCFGCWPIPIPETFSWSSRSIGYPASVRPIGIAKGRAGGPQGRVVALDLSTSWTMVTGEAVEFTGRMFEAINGMLLDSWPRSAARTTRIGASPDAGQSKGRG